MNTQPSPQAKSDPPSSSQGGARPVQTGALPGGQPGHGVNTSSSPAGQSNVDAAEREGVEYGRKNERPDR